jgi:hypothetical protein
MAIITKIEMLKLTQVLATRLYSSLLNVLLYKPNPKQEKVITDENIKLAKVISSKVYQDFVVKKRILLPKYIAEKNMQNSINNSHK